MSEKYGRLWGIHGGRTGDADGLFLKKGYVALGWPRIGDLSRLSADREAFKSAIAEAYPNKKPGAIPVDAGQLYRFVHEVRTGDFVAYPSKIDRQIHVGRIVNTYEYAPTREEGYPHQREVNWIRSAPRTRFSQGALYEIGSAMSFFQIRNYAEEYLAKPQGESLPKAPSEDETVALVAQDIEYTTRDFVLKKLATELKGHPFAEFVAHLLEAMGYYTRVSPEGPDGGIDIIAHKDELGFEPPIVKVQVKSGEGSVGDPVVSALYGKVDSSEYGLLIALGTFTNQAKAFARAKGNLRLIDGEELVDLIFAHYDQFDGKYKGLIPLKRVYIPEPLEEGSDA